MSLVKDLKIEPQNTLVNGYKGKLFDWSKFCWDGSAIYVEKCQDKDCDHKHEYKANLPFVDGDAKQYEYIHVPYDWEDDQKVFRLYPKWEVGKLYYGKIIQAVKAIKKDDGWYWRLECEDD